MPGLAETLAIDWQKAARFYARFGITEAMFRNGVPSRSQSIKGSLDFLQDLRLPVVDEKEVALRAAEPV